MTAISRALARAFSLLPAENATGNWVKVTQRVPGAPGLLPNRLTSSLAAGLSATRRSSTPATRRRLFGGDQTR